MAKSSDAFRTISEVADWLETPAHVLRFWESKFSQVKPVKRAGGRRYYRPADMDLLSGIKKLLHDDGMTIKGVQKVLREQGVRYVASLAAQPADPSNTDHGALVEDAPYVEVPIDDTLDPVIAFPRDGREGPVVQPETDFADWGEEAPGDADTVPDTLDADDAADETDTIVPDQERSAVLFETVPDYTGPDYTGDSDGAAGDDPAQEATQSFEPEKEDVSETAETESAPLATGNLTGDEEVPAELAQGDGAPEAAETPDIPAPAEHAAPSDGSAPDAPQTGSQGFDPATAEVFPWDEPDVPELPFDIADREIPDDSAAPEDLASQEAAQPSDEPEEATGTDPAAEQTDPTEQIAEDVTEEPAAAPAEVKSRPVSLPDFDAAPHPAPVPEPMSQVGPLGHLANIKTLSPQTAAAMAAHLPALRALRDRLGDPPR
jgi:DNA-binding transcriptional MerR regulator